MPTHFMKHHAFTALLAISAFSIFSEEKKPGIPLPDAHKALGEELAKRIEAQLERTAGGQTLHQMWYDHGGQHTRSRTVIVNIAEGRIEMVTEAEEEDGYFSQDDATEFTQKVYHLHEGAVYAMRVTRHEPCVDGKTHRITQSWLLFDNGTPFYRSGVTIRLPKDESPDDIFSMEGTSPESESTPPPGYEGWGTKLTARAYDLARQCRHGVGGDRFGDWNERLLKGAPPEGSSRTPPRTKGWLPPADTLVLPVERSGSPDGMFAIGWGYEKGPVDWAKLQGSSAVDGSAEPDFSTKVAVGPLTDELKNDGNFLLNAVTGKPVSPIGIYYPGERQRFNHDELIARWSPTSQCVIVLCSQKWFTGDADIVWMKDGRSTGSQDILAPLNKAVRDAILKSKHPAAKRLRVEKDRDLEDPDPNHPEGYCYTIKSILLEDDGSFEAAVIGQIPKDDAPSGYFEVVIKGTFTPGSGDSAAVLKTRSATVVPYKPIE